MKPDAIKKICDNCKKREATIRISKLVKGKVNDMWLCNSCAARRSPYHKPNSLYVEKLLEVLLQKEGDEGARRADDEERQCPTCGLPLRSYRETFFLGCSDCYTAFEEILVRDLQRYHGATTHVGRKPNTDAAPLDPHLAIKDLQRRLEVAVRREDFEMAARLRDEIRQLKAQLRESDPSTRTKEE